MLLVIGAALGLAACAGHGFTPDGPAEFRLGYVDGCMQGYTDGNYPRGHPRDEDAFINDAVYRKGWEEGHAQCYAWQIRAPQIFGAGAGGQS